MASLGEVDWQRPLNCVPFVKYLILEREALLSITKGQGLQNLTQGRVLLALQGPEFTPGASWEEGGRTGSEYR